MRTLEDMFKEEYGNYSIADLDEMIATQSPVEKAFTANQPSIQNIPQNAIQRGLELAGIGLEDAAKFLEGLGSVEIAGVPVSLRTLLPLDTGTSEALKTAGSGMPLTTGSGILNRKFKPEFTEAGKEIALATVAAKPIEKGIKAIGKATMKNKAKVAAGVTALTASSANKEKAKQ